MRNKLELVTVTNHGSCWVDPDSVFVCPECQSESDGMVGDCVEFRLEHKQKHIKGSAFYDVYADCYFAHCKHCGCKFQELRNIRKVINWGSIVWVTAVTLIAILIAALVFTTPAPVL